MDARSPRPPSQNGHQDQPDRPHTSAATLIGAQQLALPRYRLPPQPQRSQSAVLPNYGGSHHGVASPEPRHHDHAFQSHSVHGAGFFGPPAHPAGSHMASTLENPLHNAQAHRLDDVPQTSLYALRHPDPDHNPSVHMLPHNGNSSHHVHNKAADIPGMSIRYPPYGSQHPAAGLTQSDADLTWPPPEGDRRLSQGSGRVVMLDTLHPGPLEDHLAHGRSTRAWVIAYFRKWRGVSGEKPAPRDTWNHMAWGWLGSFVSILSIALLNSCLSPNINLPVLVASFGASAVLLFGVPEAKLSQPRNFLGGHIVSVLVGVSVRNIFNDSLAWLSAAFGMSTALFAMQLTQTTHPPGGATALIASSIPSIGPWHGFKFVLTVLFGSGVMLIVALIVNNLSDRRRYPMFWF